MSSSGLRAEYSEGQECRLLIVSLDDVRLEEFAKSVLSKSCGHMAFVKSLAQSESGWKWESSFRFLKEERERSFRTIVEACESLVVESDAYLASHLEYVLCHDQPCLAVLSPMAYETMKLAFGAPSQKKREIVQALCRAPKTSIDPNIQQRLLAVLAGEKVKPPLCQVCRAYSDYLTLHGRL